MPLFRVTCALDERYVIADDVKQAFNIATKNWAALKDTTPLLTGHVIVRVDQVQDTDPWK